MLADLVEELKKTGLEEAPADLCYAGAEDVACDVCTRRKRKACKSCLQCLASYCDKHLQPHHDAATFKKHKLVEPSKKLQENICSLHDEVMKISVSVISAVDEHKGHDTVSAAAERTERQRELEGCRQNIQQRIQDREKEVKLLQQEVEAVNGSADKAVEDSEKMFTELIRLMEKRSSDGSRQNIQQRIQDREKEVKLLQQEVEAVNGSADKAVEDKRSSDVKQQVRRQNIQQRIHSSRKVMKQLQQEVDGINHSANKDVKDSEKIFIELIRFIQKKSSDLKQQVKSQQESLTWGDDTTQQVLSKELSKLRRVPFRTQQNGAVYNTDSRVKPVQLELSRNLQTYLQRLGLIPKTSSSSSLSSQGKTDRFQSGVAADYYRSKPQKSSSFSSSSSSSSSFSPVQKQQRPPPDGDFLRGALRQYLSLKSGRGDPKLRPFYSNGIENTGLKTEEKFIQKVLQSVGRHHVDVDGLTQQDLSQLSRLITEALQPDLFTKLLAYLDKSSFSSAPSARNLDNLNMETPGGRQVGLENVQSRTSEAGVTVQKKDAAQQLEEVSEVHGWIKDVAPPPAALVYDDPHKKTLQVPELQLDVKEEGGKKADENVFGYIITDTDGLQTDKGLHLMEILAHMAKIQMTDFAELSL
ncbi:hypothetical protein F7725_011046 [Dissostichus mawsoni]|uniref:Uncharacterized protein n=1 Tax=Dissostichus mawsoni TaxID=36200 RepID=A0A7J5Z7V3_DISMA|nr:hypothetical protein F7725_011046 [Dissostichus mawsoni]